MFDIDFKSITIAIGNEHIGEFCMKSQCTYPTLFFEVIASKGVNFFPNYVSWPELVNIFMTRIGSSSFTRLLLKNI